MNTKTLESKNTLSLLIYGCRPKTLTASAFPVILGMFLAKYDGMYNIITYLQTLLTALFLQMGANYANDYFDHKDGRDTKDRLGPKRLSSLKLISKKTLLSAMTLTFILASILTIPLINQGGIIILYLLVLGVLTAIFYSYSQFSLANTGIANVVVFIVFGPLATLMTYYLQTQSYSQKAAFLGILPGCLSLMLFAMNNLRDIEEDTKGGKKTLVVRLGFNWGKIEYIAALFISWLLLPLSMIIYNAPLITLLPLVLLPKGVKLITSLKNSHSPVDIVPLFEKTAKHNMLFALLYIIAWRIALL